MNENQTENLSFEDEILKKYDNGISLTEDEISELINGYEIESEDLDEYRWTTLKKTVIKINNRYFEIEWQCANTEMQENCFLDSRLVEVVPVEKTTTVTETVYKRI